MQKVRTAVVVGFFVGAVSIGLVAQGGPFGAAIENFWQIISTGGRTFTNISVSGGTISGVTLTPTAPETLAVNGIATTSTDALLLTNTTAATALVPVQQSPRLRFRSNVWNTTVTAANNTNDWFVESVPVSGTTPSGLLKFGSALNGSAATFPLTVTSDGIVASIGNFDAAGRVSAGSTSYFYWLNRSVMRSPADGQINFNNVNENAGFGLDLNTVSVAKFRTIAQNAYATVDALAYRSSGTPVTSGTTFLTSGSGMAVANVGANSCGTSTATIAGNNNVNVTTVGATAGTQCRIAFTVTATTEWDCTASDQTTTIAIRVTPVDTTHTDLIGAFVAGDKITAICFPR